MTGGKGRLRLSQPTGQSGSDGALIVQKPDPGADGADLVPGSALRWPPCECGHAVLCPDYVTTEPDVKGGE
ncbi:hypothetical protein [Streptomyces sp. NPDC088725]|uniref:hypothetical protein n=1 Tax=Streptomyces sp. NPDC088725 TaxID=3365873 RepID=UPI00381CBC8C